MGQPFLFGKLPAHGDFVSRGLLERPRQAWDDWASGALDALRAAGGDFEDAHGAIPPWRFVAGPSARMDGWRAGALAPSIDSAGRRFVLVAGVEGCAAQVAGAMGATIAGLAEDILYRALSEGLTADQTIAVIGQALGERTDEAAAAAILSAAPAGPGAWWSAGVGALASCEPPDDLLAAASQARLRELGS